jgi:Ca-activated chloride channel family protein
MYSELLGSFTAWQGDRAYRAGDLAKARAFYEDAVSAFPHDMQALYNVGKIAYKEKDYATARKAFEKVGAAPESSSTLKEQAYFNKGDSEFMDKQLDQALSSYEQVLKLNPENTHAKERIEMLKKQKEEQKKSEQQDQQQKQDTKDQEHKSEQGGKDSQKNKDQAPTERDSQDTKNEQPSNKDNESSDQQQKDKNQEEKQNQRDDTDKTQQQDKKSQEDADKDSNEQQDRNQKDSKKGGERSADSRTRDEQKKEKEQDKSQQGAPHDSEKQEQPSPQSVPEDQLNAQERVGLEHIEERDKKAYKHFFGRTDVGKRLQPGQKNW